MDEDDRCEQCGAPVLPPDDDARTYCENGHDQGRALATGDDDLDFARQGKILKKRERKEKQKVFRVLRGARAYQLFLQSWQLILRKQCYALVHQKGFPPELWTIVRDLWVLWLSRLDHRLHDPTTQEGSQPQSLPGSTSDADPATTSANETETDTDPEKDEERRGTRQQQQQRTSAHVGPALVDTIVLNYLGILLLQRPIGLSTVLKWIQHEEIPFIRAIRHVPAEMKDRLPGEYHLSLDTIRILEPDNLQAAVYRRAKMYSMTFGMAMPRLNYNLFLLDYVRSLSLPIEVCSIAQRLNAITEYRFCYPDPTVALASQATRRQPTTYPETQLISLIVVATKLLFPFDSQTVKRYPKDVNHPTSLHMDWAAWLDAKRKFDNNPQTDSTKNGNGAIDPGSAEADLDPGSAIHVSDSDILRMTDRQLDQYMDWYQQTWMEEPPSQEGRSQDNTLDKDILDMFPLHDLPEQRVETREEHERRVAADQSRLTARIQNVQSSLASRRAVPPAEKADRGIEVLRPGAMYPHIRNVEDLDRAEHVVRVFHEDAAQTACISVKTLLRAVNHCEEKIEQWLRARRREEVFGHHDNNDDETEEGSSDDQGDHVDEEEGQDKKHQPLTSGREGAATSRVTAHTYMLATSPPPAIAPGTLARDLSGLEIESPTMPVAPGPSSDDMEIEIDMQM